MEKDFFSDLETSMTIIRKINLKDACCKKFIFKNVQLSIVWWKGTLKLLKTTYSVIFKGKYYA